MNRGVLYIMSRFYITKNKEHVFDNYTKRIFSVNNNMYKLFHELNNSNNIFKTLKSFDLSPKLYNEMYNILEYSPNNDSLNNNSVEELELKNLNTIQLVVCNYCNLSCNYCYANEGTYNFSKENMSFETAIKAIEFALDNSTNLKQIKFFGGEPSLNSTLIEEVCDFLYKEYYERMQKISLIIVSNMFDIKDKFINVIDKYNITVATSLDGPKELNDINRITKSNLGSYDRVKQNIKKMRQICNQPQMIEVTITESHGNIEISDILKKLNEEFEIKKFAVCTDININDDYGNQDTASKIKSVIKSIDNMLEEKFYDDKVEYLFNLLKKPSNSSKMFCNAGFGQITIMPNGDIYPCHMYALDKENIFYQGNIYSSKCAIEKSILKTQNHLSSYFKSRISKCKNCVYTSLCSNCLGSELIKHQNFIPSSEKCLYLKELYYELVEKLIEIRSDEDKWRRLCSIIAEMRTEYVKN